MDPDHLDIYQTKENMAKGFESYISQIREKGKLILKYGLSPRIPDHVARFTYSLKAVKADYYGRNIKSHGLGYRFNVVAPNIIIPEIQLAIPGLINVENAIAASAVAHQLGLAPEVIARALSGYKGVERRLDMQVHTENRVYIDDYAHHPEEIKAFLTSIRKLFPGRKLTGIFQPHLFTRTRDFAEGFAQSLELLDSLILMDIYPAREEPIPEITSAVIFEKVNLKEKVMITREQVMRVIREQNPELLVTMGAGDISQFVSPLRDWMMKKR
jgi:UDP-N-acetylmuramate--alanine ligase